MGIIEERGCQKMAEGPQKEAKEKAITIRVPHDLWVKLRNLRTAEKIKSIQSAAIKGLEQILKERG